MKAATIAFMQQRAEQISEFNENNTIPTMGKRAAARRKARREYKLAKKELRNERQYNRTKTRQVAYENGIDPNSSMWQGISSLGQSAATFGLGAMAAKKGGRVGAVSSPLGSAVEAEMGESPTGTKSNNMMMYIFGGVALLAFMFMKK